MEISKKEETNYSKVGIIGFRCVEILCIGAIITGFVWASSDYLLATILAKSPVTPASVLMIVYGSLGTFLCEVTIWIFKRAEKRFLLPQAK
jgi:hypothetical protein